MYWQKHGQRTRTPEYLDGLWNNQLNAIKSILDFACQQLLHVWTRQSVSPCQDKCCLSSSSHLVKPAERPGRLNYADCSVHVVYLHIQVFFSLLKKPGIIDSRLFQATSPWARAPGRLQKSEKRWCVCVCKGGGARNKLETESRCETEISHPLHHILIKAILHQWGCWGGRRGALWLSICLSRATTDRTHSPTPLPESEAR